jgi:hypothetical protein
MKFGYACEKHQQYNLSRNMKRRQTYDANNHAIVPTYSNTRNKELKIADQKDFMEIDTISYGNMHESSAPAASDYSVENKTNTCDLSFEDDMDYDGDDVIIR